MPGMQRHHLLPKQLLGQRSFGKMFEQIGRERIGFDDFRLNGLLLPSHEEAAQRVRMPLHRGPHRDYNGMVTERVGQIEASWSRMRLLAPEVALDDALMRLDLLQRALRRRLLADDRPRFRLNRHDRIDVTVDFTDLDAMADALWADTGSASLPAPVFPSGEMSLTSSRGAAPLEALGTPEPPPSASPPRSGPPVAPKPPPASPVGEMPVQAVQERPPDQPFLFEPARSFLYRLSAMYSAAEGLEIVLPADPPGEADRPHSIRH